MPLRSHIVELSPAVRARSPVVVLFFLIALIIPLPSAFATATSTSPSRGPHRLPELFGLVLPLRLASTNSDWHVHLTGECGLLPRHLDCFLSFGLSEDLLVLSVDDAMLLTVELLSLLLEHLLADLHMLSVGYGVEIPAAARALLKVYVAAWLERFAT